MVEGLSLGVLGIGSGWAIVCLGVVMIFRGALVTSREANAIERRAEAAEAAGVLKDKTIAEFVDAIGTNNALLASLHDVARERS